MLTGPARDASAERAWLGCHGRLARPCRSHTGGQAARGTRKLDLGGVFGAERGTRMESGTGSGKGRGTTRPRGRVAPGGGSGRVANPFGSGCPGKLREVRYFRAPT